MKPLTKLVLESFRNSLLQVELWLLVLKLKPSPSVPPGATAPEGTEVIKLRWYHQGVPPRCKEDVLRKRADSSRDTLFGLEWNCIPKGLCVVVIIERTERTPTWPKG